MIAYCVKCRQKRQMKNERKTKVNGRDMVKGICGVCGTKMSTFV
jgi:hypothetical protein